MVFPTSPIQRGTDTRRGVPKMPDLADLAPRQSSKSLRLLALLACHCLSDFTAAVPVPISAGQLANLPAARLIPGGAQLLLHRSDDLVDVRRLVAGSRSGVVCRGDRLVDFAFGSRLCGDIARRGGRFEFCSAP